MIRQNVACGECVSKLIIRFTDTLNDEHDYEKLIICAHFGPASKLTQMRKLFRKISSYRLASISIKIEE